MVWIPLLQLKLATLFTEQFNITLPPTIFFEFQDLESFTGYLMVNHKEEMENKYADQIDTTSAPTESEKPATAPVVQLQAVPSANSNTPVATPAAEKIPSGLGTIKY